jgi:hypothetical protein
MYSYCIEGAIQRKVLTNCYNMRSNHLQIISDKNGHLERLQTAEFADPCFAWFITGGWGGVGWVGLGVGECILLTHGPRAPVGGIFHLL